MHRPGLMAPPTLYDEPQQPGLMAASAAAELSPISLRAFLWAVALVLGAVELCFEALS
jgi:hypothetical protein